MLKLPICTVITKLTSAAPSIITLVMLAAKRGRVGTIEASNLAILQGEGISSSLHYASGQVTVPGKSMAFEQFVPTLMASGDGWDER